MPLLTSSGSPPAGFRSSAAVALVGFSAILGQIVLIRELIVTFSGNEISLGIMLAMWLLWTAVGSGLGNHLARSNARLTVAVGECLFGCSLLATVWAVRASKVLFQSVPGELVGPLPIMLTALATLSVFCVLSGYLFVAAARMYGEERGVSAGVASSSAYLYEAGGSAFGGILASVVLLRFLDSFQIAAIVALANLCMAAILLFGGKRKRHWAVAVAAGCLAPGLFFYAAPSLLRSSQARLWHGFRVLESRDSIYGNLAVTETGNILSIYDNGVIVGNAPDPAAAEEAVHYALLEHAAPRRVLLIGGGGNGSVSEVLKHPTVEHLDYVELDPALVEITRRYVPAQAAAFADSRVRTHSADGRLYLTSTDERFDVVILNLPNPQTAQLNRFYTADFFRSVREHLTPDGLFGLQLQASEDYISPALAEFLRCIQKTLLEVFPFTATIPGESMHFFAAARPNGVTEDPQVLLARLRARGLQTQYVREYFIPFRMMPDRLAQVHGLLRPLPTTPVNRDFSPIAYYFDVVLWSAQFQSDYSRWFRAAANVTFSSVVEVTLACLLFVGVLLAYVPGRGRRAPAAYCMAATGFTLMALQIFLLLTFQSVYGYVYHQLAILVAMLMAGIALGSWLGMDRVRSGKSSSMSLLTVVQMLLAVSGPALILLVHLLSRAGGTVSQLAAQVVFPLLAVLCGLLGGFQFPVATAIYLRERAPGTSVGTLYALDVFGGCVGALLLSTYLIPVFGFWKTAWLSAAVNLAPALLAFRAARPATADPA